MKLPFECLVEGTEDTRVKNPFSGESCMLTPEALAVYDTIKGAEILGNPVIVSKGCSWFQANYPEEYWILLD